MQHPFSGSTEQMEQKFGWTTVFACFFIIVTCLPFKPPGMVNLLLALLLIELFPPVCQQAHQLRRMAGRGPAMSVTAVCYLMFLGVSWLVVYELKQAFPANQIVTSISLAWIVIAPLDMMLIVFVTLIEDAAFRLHRPRKPVNAVIVGVTSDSVALYRTVRSQQNCGIKFVQLFDDRRSERLGIGQEEVPYLPLSVLPDYLKQLAVQSAYLAFPLNNSPRLQEVFHCLQDSTASIYLVSGVPAIAPIQAKLQSVNNPLIIALFDTPMQRGDAVLKRLLDIFISSFVLLLLSPLLLFIALGVKLSSPGPVLFKQKRYGLNGEAVRIYKFRSMRVCEDGGVIHQAKKQDPRVTRFGAFLRKSSLDELPQLLNVLLGTMSLVGPRPHAVAHNEMYRKLIHGYMLRHKVRPGLTGWAQIHGFRGETRALAQMQRRIDYDLAYLRGWSFFLDVWIILRTPYILLSQKNAY